MGEAEKGRNINININTSSGMDMLQMDKFPRDLLQRFMAPTSNTNNKSKRREQEEEKDEEEEFELNLGLSLGGRFGVDKNPKKLTRSSSIASTLPVIRDDNDVINPTHFSYPTLIKTSSLPTVREEDWRKRKELQTLRRMEAKRRRSEKQKKNDKGSVTGGCLEKGVEEETRDSNLRDKQYMFAAMASTKFGSSFRLPSWVGASREGGAVDLKAKGGLLGCSSGFQGFGQPNSQGSVESQGGNSSGASEFESKPFQGASSCEARSSGINQPLQERSNQEDMGSCGMNLGENKCRTSDIAENPSRKPDSRENKGKEIGTNAMEDMPCVFTKGDGPNGRRIDGILYKYGKGEEVRIMCVCHGTFLSPAEFVKHAGGTDVDHPLRHIVVNTSASSFL